MSAALALLCGLLAVAALALHPRLEVTVALLALYLGLLDGPIKLLVHNQAASAIRDALIAAIALGALTRAIQGGRGVRLPPLSGWVIVFVALVVVQAFNPNTHGALKVIGGFRQQLEWVPFFFFGYALMRSRERFRKLFLILGVIALANGLVSTYQTRLTPAQLASWGPGYAELVHGSETLSARKYVSEGVARVRPPGLGSDTGFAGGMGVLALTGALALLASATPRRRWLATLLCLGALLAVATSLARLSAVGAVVGALAFLALSLSAGHRATRSLGALLTVGALALPLGALLVASEDQGVFSRYESIAPKKVVATSTGYKEASLGQIPHVIATTPFGFGLASAGPASAFGGRSGVELEGHGFSAETQYNFVTDELGLPGLLLWVSLSLTAIGLAVRGLPRVKDVDVRIYLAGMFAAFIAFTIMGFDGPAAAGVAFGSYFWFALGTAAYWFAGPGRRADENGIVAVA
ncbi:MAG TPA: hypothetical protein VFY36_03140 [Solirubrobacteraceae bacterium]|nr:hypothetical protein [Solirubrobacteraceae bacterium]